jgi:hypothetical protein
VMYASLRMDPKNNSGNIINTMNNLFDPVRQKYKDKVELIHQEGDSEPAYLFEIKP